MYSETIKDCNSIGMHVFFHLYGRGGRKAIYHSRIVGYAARAKNPETVSLSDHNTQSSNGKLLFYHFDHINERKHARLLSYNP